MVTDMAETHFVAPLSSVDLAKLFRAGSSVLVAADLRTPVRQMMAAAEAGGSAEQRTICEELEGMQEAAARTPSTTSSGKQQIIPPRKRKRKLDLGNNPKRPED
jgi:hypothetical protein